MAQATTNTVITYQLSLSEQEADFIKNLVQNPMESHESNQTAKMRQSIFNSLNDCKRQDYHE